MRKALRLEKSRGRRPICLPAGLRSAIQPGVDTTKLVARKYLPRRGLLGTDWPRWEELGCRILDDEDPDDLLCCVELPIGWLEVSTDDQFWTSLVDGLGKVRAWIFKFYRGDAWIHLLEP